MKLSNTTAGDLGLDPDTIVPSQSAIEIEPAELRRRMGNPVVAHWLATGALVADWPQQEPEPEPEAERRAKTRRKPGRRI